MLRRGTFNSTLRTSPIFGESSFATYTGRFVQYVIYIMSPHNHRPGIQTIARRNGERLVCGAFPALFILQGATVSPAKSNSYGADGHPRLRPLTRGPVPLICLTKILSAVH